MPPNPDVAGAATTATSTAHGIEVAVEFKPVEHPIEPLDNDPPIQCPLPEPSILNVRLYSQFIKIWLEYLLVQLLLMVVQGKWFFCTAS